MQQEPSSNMLSAGAEPPPLLGDPEHLAFDAFEEPVGKDERVACELGAAVEDMGPSVT